MRRMPEPPFAHLALEPGSVGVDHGVVAEAVRASEGLAADVATERFDACSKKSTDDLQNKHCPSTGGG